MFSGVTFYAISSIGTERSMGINTDRFNALKMKAITLKSSRDTIERNLSVHTSSFEKMTAEYESICSGLADLEEAYVNLKTLIERYSMKHVHEIEQIVTMGLQTIFYDRELSFTIKVSDQRNSKYAEFFLTETKDGTKIETPLKSDRVAGGILVVCGFILQVYFIQYFNKANLIVADECFSQLSSSYINGLFTFIERLKKKMNLIIVLVTHDERFVDFADKVFVAESGKFRIQGRTAATEENNG